MKIFSKQAAYRFLPFFNYALKRLGLRQSLSVAADKAEILQPEESEDVPLPLCLKGQTEFIIGVPPWDDLRDTIASATRTHFVNAPVVRYTLKNCVAYEYGFDFLGGRFNVSPFNLKDFLIKPLANIEDALYPMSFVSRKYFGHFLTDACATALLAQPGQALLIDDNKDWPHAAEYISAFNLKPAMPMPSFVQRLTFCSDLSEGTNKRTRYDELRRRIALSYGPRGTPTEAIYLRRGRTGAARLIADEDRLADELAARGYKIVTLEGATAADLAGQLRNARRVLSIEGSHISHVYYLAPPGVDLCVLMPNDRTVFVHRGISHSFGGRFGFVVCRRAGDAYRLDLDQVLRTLDLFD